LKSEGMQPAPERPSSWRTFLKAHWGEVAAADFFTSEVWTQKGLMTYYTLFVIDLKTRRIHIAGSTTTPDESFMAQGARNLTDGVDGFLLRHRYLICDRDSKFTTQFRRALESAGIVTILTPHRAPNCNAFAERFVRSIKEECLNRMMLFGEGSLHRAIREFVEHYHGERPHQGLGNRIIQFHSRPLTGASTTGIRGHDRLGGMLRRYRRAA
jgi:transposase InsO family protein